jgi:hypothetical protein
MDIEEDIKKVKELNNLLKFFKTHGWIPNLSRNTNINETIEAIEHILAEREEDKKRIKELEEENRIFKDSNVLVNRYFKLKDNSIPVQKVKEALEDIEDYFDRLNGPDEDMKYIRNKKKELLEEK